MKRPCCAEHSAYRAVMWAPLHLVQDRLTASTRLDDSFFNIDDFMHMSWCHEARPHGLMLYKHRDTHRYLNLDAGGQAYRYLPPQSDEAGDLGSYEPHDCLRDALDHLGLWELPWTRPELEAFTGGISYDDRFSIWDRLIEEGLHRAS